MHVGVLYLLFLGVSFVYGVILALVTIYFKNKKD